MFSTEPRYCAVIPPRINTLPVRRISSTIYLCPCTSFLPPYYDHLKKTYKKTPRYEQTESSKVVSQSCCNTSSGSRSCVVGTRCISFTGRTEISHTKCFFPASFLSQRLFFFSPKARILPLSFLGLEGYLLQFAHHFCQPLGLYRCPTHSLIRIYTKSITTLVNAWVLVCFFLVHFDDFFTICRRRRRALFFTSCGAPFKNSQITQRTRFLSAFCRFSMHLLYMRKLTVFLFRMQSKRNRPGKLFVQKIQL